MSSETPPPSSWSIECGYCGFPINAEILVGAEGIEVCPHGWVSLEGMNVADIKGLFAGDDVLSIDPVIDRG